MSTAWLAPFLAQEAARRAAPGRPKDGGPGPAEFGIALARRSNDPRSHYGCVFFDEARNECTAGKYTQNQAVHNDCATSGKVWVRINMDDPRAGERSAAA